MKNLQALLEAREALSDETVAICDAAEAAERGFEESERTKIDANKAEIESLDAQIAEAQEDEKRTAFVRTTQATQNAGRGRRTSLASPAKAEGMGVATAIEVGKTLIEDHPTFGYNSPREFMMDVITAGMEHPTQTVINPDALKILSTRNRGQISATAGSDEAGEYSDAYGGFFVPAAYSPSMLQIDAEGDPVGGLTTPVPMATPVVKIPARVDTDHSDSVSGGLTVTRRAETAAMSASRMELKQIELTANNLYGFSYITEELLMDSPQSFAAILAAGFGDEFTSVIFDERLNGTGVGEFLGINNSPALISVDKAGGQPAETIRYENITAMRARCWKYGNAVWLANHDTIPQLALLNVTVGTGGQILWHTDARDDIPDRLMGRPLIFTEYTNTIGDAGDILLVNWAEYLSGILQPLQSAESIHVRFAEHERAFKFWMRNAGVPWWTAALTPKNGDTLSPYVRLAARA